MAFPQDELDFRVSLGYGQDPGATPSSWTLTPLDPEDVLAPIVIRRGRTNEQSSTEPSWADLALRNDDGPFSPRNPTGPNFGNLRRNTPARIEVNNGSGYVNRFTGFVPDWTPTWTGPAVDDRMPILAMGPLRQLGQGNNPVKSLTLSIAQYLAAAFASTYLITTYWTLEDGSGSTEAVPGLPVGTPMSVAGTVDFAAVTPPAGSAAAPNVSGGSLTGTCNNSITTNQWSVTFYFKATGDCRVLNWTTTGSLSWFVDVTTTNVTVGNSAGGSAAFSATNYTDGEWHVINVFGSDGGGGAVSFSIFGDSADIASSFTGSATPGRVSTITGNPNTDANLVSVNHILVGGTTTSSITAAVMNGDPGSSAMANFAAIASFNGIAVDYNNSIIFDTELMGPYPVGTVLDAMQQTADADEGLLTERLDGRLGFDSHIDRENLPVSLALDYEAGHLQLGSKITDDDRLVRNDVTATRIGGVSATVQRTDGPLSIDSVGSYPQTPRLNLYTDQQPRPHASWRVNIGTVDEPRFPVVVLDLATHPELIDDWLTCDIGSRITITNLPPQHFGYDDADLILEGYTETLDAEVWKVDLNLAPYKPYEIFVVAEDAGDNGEFVGRLAEDPDAAIRSAITASATSIAFDPNRYRWTTYAGLVVPGTAGNYASTPDAAALDITGDLDLRAEVTLADWTPAAEQTFVAKHLAPTDRSYWLRLNTSGMLNLLASNNGTGYQVNAPSTVAPTSDARGRLAVRATIDVDNGAAGNTVTFYTAPTIDGTWTQLGAPVVQAGTMTIFAGTALLEVGAAGGGTVLPMTGTVHAVEVYNGIAGTVVANPSFKAQTLGTTSFADAAGRTWTVNGTAVIEGNFPLDVRFGGEVATVSAISTTPVTFVAVGAASSADAAAVSPAIYAGDQADDLIVVVAGLRSTPGTTGAPTKPTGYHRLAVFDDPATSTTGAINVQVYVKLHDGSESAPSVGVQDAGAGDTLTAFTFGLRGMPLTVDLDDLIADFRIQTNAAATNIAYPGLYPNVEGCFVLMVGWRQDDYTSIAPPTGFTEMIEASTTVGSDQGLYAAYQIQTNPAVVNEGSMVVTTGGGTAASRSAVIALVGGYQTMTVTRNVNGIVGGKAHTAGTLLEIEDAHVLGL